jgi:hypothetical protein
MQIHKAFSVPEIYPPNSNPEGLKPQKAGPIGNVRASRYDCTCRACRRARRTERMEPLSRKEAIQVYGAMGLGLLAWVAWGAWKVFG